MRIFITLMLALMLTGSAAAFTLFKSSKGASAITINENLWDELRQEFKLQDATQLPQVQKQLKRLKKQQHHITKLAKESTPYLYYVHQRVKARNLPAELVLLPMIESAYDPFAHSSVGAAGLWQIMPLTGTSLGLEQNWWYDARRDIYASTEAALDYLEYLNKRFDGNWLLTLAAYDYGAGAVNRAIKKNKKRGKSTDFWSLPLPRETRSYIPKLLALATIVKTPEKYSIQLPQIANQQHFDQVDIGHQINLDFAAKLAGISTTSLYQLNPGFNRWSTAPEGPHVLVLPIDKINAFKEKLKNIPKTKIAKWREHVIKRGETLSSIAKLYRIPLTSLKAANQLSSDILQIGKVLAVPPGQHPFKKRMTTPIFYKIRPGDSLWKIASRHNVSVGKLKKWNKHAQGKYLQPGKRLKIYRA